MKTVLSAGGESVRAAAEQLLAQIERKKDAVIALGAGEAELRVLRCAATLAKERGLSLREARFLAVCEFEGLAPTDPRLVRRRLESAFFAENGADADKLYVPDAGEPAAYDDLIARLGGIDLALLGLGENARVGFNEPATQFDTHTHVQKLTDRTKTELAPFFGGGEEIPQRGVTMGFRELCAARDIVVIVLGESKQKALFHMLYGRDDSVYPAAFLQLPPNVTVYADTEAAKLLGEKHFDTVAFNGD